MSRWKQILAGSLCVASAAVLVMPAARAHTGSQTAARGWWQLRGRPMVPTRTAAARSPRPAALTPQHVPPETQALRDSLEGQRLFERETFGGNGRTCLTCHSRETGTVSPGRAGRFARQPRRSAVRSRRQRRRRRRRLWRRRHVRRMLGRRDPPHADSAASGRDVEGSPGDQRSDGQPRHPDDAEYAGAGSGPDAGRPPTDLQAQALGAIADHAQATRTINRRSWT